jgi:hypothetical protein
MSTGTKVVQTRWAIGVLWFGLMVTWWSSEPSSFNDTRAYQSAASLSEIPWLGEGWRAWPTMLVYLLSDNPRLITLAQTVLFATAWSLAIWAFFRKPRGVIGLVGMAGTVVLALTPAVMQWNMALLSESVSISFLVIGLASGYRAIEAQTESTNSNRGVIPWATFSILMLGLSALNRPTYILVLLAVGGLLSSAVWKRHLSPWGGAAVLFLTLLVSSYALVVNVNIDKSWGVSRSTTHYLYLTSAGGGSKPELTDPLFEYVTSQGPSCLVSFRASSVDPETDPWQMRRILNQGCPEGVDWLNGNFAKVYTTFMLSHPQYVHWYIRTYGPTIMGPDSYAPIVAVIPSSLASLFQTSSVGDQKFVPFIGWIGLLILCLGLAATRWRRATDRWGLGYLALSGGVVLVSALVTLLTQSWEVTRIAAPAASALVLLSMALWAALFGDRSIEAPKT